MNLWRQLRRIWRGPRPQSRKPFRRGKRQHRNGAGVNHHRPSLQRSLRAAAAGGLRNLLSGTTRPHLMRGRVVAYHGTPSVTNARSILKDGFMAGGGNALGDGIYLAIDLSTAKGYTGSTGVYLKCLVKLGRTCMWGPSTQARYAAWCLRHGVQQDNSAMTGFLMRNGFNTVQNGKVVVVLSPGYRNPTAWKRKSRFIRVLSVHRVADGARIKV